jgi:hypothetical protein
LLHWSLHLPDSYWCWSFFHGFFGAAIFVFFFLGVGVGFWDRILLCDPVWPQTHNPPASASLVLGLQKWITLPGRGHPIFPILPCYLYYFVFSFYIKLCWWISSQKLFLGSLV